MMCLVTGATGGIGRALAESLARSGAAVVIVGRGEARCEQTASDLRRATANAAIGWLAGDLAVQADVRRIAERFVAEYGRLDVLVNNAGRIFARRQTTPDGIEMTFALNHLAYFLLTALLHDVLVASSPARVINVASSAHFSAKLDIDDLQSPRRYRPFGAYETSKLANVLFTYELARRLTGSGVTANAVHPGYVRTHIARNNGRLVSGIKWLIDLRYRSIAISAEQAASDIAYLALARAVEGHSGEYYVKRRARQSSPLSYDIPTARRLWEVSEALVGYPRPVPIGNTSAPLAPQ